MSTVFDIEWPFETKRVKNKILVKKISWISIYEKKDDQFWIYLDYRISKYIYRVIKEFQKKNIDFLFISPIFNNPFNNNLSVGDSFDVFHEENIKNYLCSFIIEDFYFNFERIKFDLILNMLKYTNKMNCFEKIKPIYDELIKEGYHTTSHNSIRCSGGRGSKLAREKEDIIKNRFINLWREIMLLNLEI